MTTVTDANVHNIAVKGTFDDCQDIVKALFADASFNAKYHLGAVNSINWARILAQIVYYFSAYFQAQKLLANTSPVPQLQFVVPTGNFGDVLAGWYAKQMGLPMAKLVVATNANDILARFWTSGRYEKQSTDDSASPENPALDPSAGPSCGAQVQGGGVKETLSPAMDILISSNFERLLWYLARDSLEDVDFISERRRLSKACSIVKGWMDSMKADGRAVVSTEALEAARKDFLASRVDDQQVRNILVCTRFTVRNAPFRLLMMWHRLLPQ
jgi:threonine synthase